MSQERSLGQGHPERGCGQRAGPAIRGHGAEPELGRRLSDISTVEGWLHVTAIIDLLLRPVVGWSISATMTAQLLGNTLMMAIWRRSKLDALLQHVD